MITVNKRPPSFSFSGNPIRYSVQSDQQYVLWGSVAIIELKFTAVDRTIGHHFHLDLMNIMLDFVISTGNNQSGLEIPPATLTDTPSSWCAKVGAAMSVNYYLHTFYDIVITGNTVLFISKQKEALYSIEFTNIDISGISVYHHQSGMNVQTRTRFGILAQVLDENENILGSDFRAVDSNGNANFDISEYLFNCLENFTPPHFTIPGIPGKIRSYADGVKVFHVAFCEMDANGPLRLFVDANRIALMGGLSREALVYWNESNPFWSSANNLQRFLTWCPSGKLSSQKQLERLYFFNRTSLSLGLNYDVFFSDGANQSVSLNTVPVNAESIIEVQAGYNDLDLGSLQPGKEVSSWRVSLRDNSGIVSQIYEFVIEQGFRKFDRQFIFRNSFGWYDVMRSTGKVESTLEYEKVEGYTITEDPETDSNSPNKVFSNLELQTFKASTGWLKKETQDWLRDFLLSKEIYEIIDGKLFAIKITSKKTTLRKDEEYNLSLSFEYSRAYKDIFFSISNGVGGPNSQSQRNYSDSYSPSYS